MDQRGIEKQFIEQTMVNNLRRFVFPYLYELARLPTTAESDAYINIIRTNIEQLVSPVSENLKGAYLKLNPAEIKVADLLYRGKSNKSIATRLKTSPSTIENTTT